MELQAVGRYQIQRKIGQGGMATVYLANDPQFNREVAVKMLSPRFAMDPEFLARFRREAQTVAQLEHNAIVPVYDFGEEDGTPYLVMRYMRGGSLDDRITNGPMPIEDAIKILSRLAAGLTLAHQRGIVHRDIKPANILFDRQGNPYLSDFGIVKLSSDATATNLTIEGIIGTPAYISPEQIEGMNEIDHRVDLYALTIIFYEMVTGKQPYRARTMGGVLSAHLARPVPNILSDNETLPGETNEVIQVGMAKDPEDRFQTADSLSLAISNLSVKGATKSNIRLPQAASISPKETFGKTEVIHSADIDLEKLSKANGHEAEPPPPSSPSDYPPQPSRNWLLGAVGLFLVGVAAFGFFQNQLFAQQAEEEPAVIALATEEGTATAEAPEETAVPTEEATAEPTATERPTLAPTLTSAPLPTATDIPTETPIPTATPTATVEPTATPEPTEVAEVVPTETIEPTATPTVEPEAVEPEPVEQIWAEVIKANTTLYAGPSTVNPSRGIFLDGTITEVMSTVCGNSWYKVIGIESDGWVSAEDVILLNKAVPTEIPIDIQFDRGGCKTQARTTTRGITTYPSTGGEILPDACRLTLAVRFDDPTNMEILWTRIPSGAANLEVSVVATNPDFAVRGAILEPTHVEPDENGSFARSYEIPYERFFELDYRIGNRFEATITGLDTDRNPICNVSAPFVWEGPAASS
ncbi:MAG: protein kinase [Chloroflexota bacterium]